MGSPEFTPVYTIRLGGMLDVIAGALIGMVVAFLVFKLKDLLEPIPTIVLKAFRIFCLA